MAADSFHPPSETMNDAFLSALAEKWRELKRCPGRFGPGHRLSVRPARLPKCGACARAASAAGAPPDAIARLWRSLCGDVVVARGLKTVYVAGGDISLSVEAARGYFGFGPKDGAALWASAMRWSGRTQHAGRAGLRSMARTCRGRPVVADAEREQVSATSRIVAGWPSLSGHGRRDAPRMAIRGPDEHGSFRRGRHAGDRP